MLSPKHKRNLSRIIPFALIWLFFGVIYSLLEKGIMADLKVYPATNTIYNFNESFPLTTIGSFLVGLFIGTLEVVYLNRIFNRFNFGVKIFLKTIIYLIIICVFLISLSLIVNSRLLGDGVFTPLVLQSVEYFVRDFAFWSVAIYIGSIVLISVFFLEVSDNLGQGVLKNFIRGKYHRPMQESRIFMFLDMKSSTTIAESLGHVTYFKLLKAYYAAMSEAIVKCSGEIYQYVGDEIVVSWSMKKGVKNNNCIRCFFEIKKEFAKRAARFERDFGLTPGFKAGIHYGKITTGEIGDVKKEILFTGDVLNTTARIQNLCNEYSSEFLISEKLLSLLKLDDNYKITHLGEKKLRGKDLSVSLLEISVD